MCWKLEAALKYICLLLYFVVLQAGEVNGDDTFYLSLNEKRSDQGQWAEANATMPALTELTVCHWEKISYFNKQFANVWSYCVKTSEDFGGITCFQYFSGIDPEEHVGGKTYIFLIRFQNSSNQEYIRMKDYEERQWNHICWRADSKGNNQYFLNGEIRHNFNYSLVVIPSENRNESSFLIGQEPDTLQGNFYNLESFRGAISGFNLWNFTLTDKTIKMMATCGKQFDGNVIKWDQKEWILENTLPQPISGDEFCSNPREIFLFPFPTFQEEAFHICKVHGGDLLSQPNLNLTQLQLELG